jgi:suppressor for copper-sensitivity B
MSLFARCHRWAVSLVCVGAIVASATAEAQVDILSGQPFGQVQGAVSQVDGPESVVNVSAQILPGTDGTAPLVSVTAQIAPPWHAYAITQKPILAIPTKLSLDPSADYKLAGEFRPKLPPETEVKGGHFFETHSGEVTWQAPLTIRDGVDLEQLQIAGQARIQVCNDQSCLNPANFPFTAVLAVAANSGENQASKGVYSHANTHVTIRGHFDPQAVPPGSTVKLTLTAEPAKGWHVYERADRDSGDLGYKPTLIAMTGTSGFPRQPTVTSEKAVQEPSGVPGMPPLRYHPDRVTWTTSLVVPKETKPGQYPIEGLIGFQACRDNECDLPRAARFSGTITVGATTVPGASPLTFTTAKYAEAAKAAVAQSASRAAGAPAGQEPDFSGLPIVILFSLLGGFVLNFMPCVLPVIGLKILSFAEQAGRSRGQTLALNVWYSLGTLAVFMVLAALSTAVNLGLREENLGWGEQFSSTGFNVVMVAIVFVFALSFLGVWEIPIPGFVGSGKAAHVAAREGAVGAVVKGALTTVLATPCSGPALGPVFGYTLNQPPAVTFLIFGCIGLGMCSPYLLIGAFPRLIRFLPKPGAWMDTFKQMMGFCMLGTIVFFFSFMNRDYLVPTFAMMIGLWAGCWWIGRTSLVETLGRKMKAWTQGAAFAALVAWASFTWLGPHDSIIPWQSFSRAELARLTGEGKTVLVDFTANWCANCKVNTYIAIETPEVRDSLAKHKIVPMLADWSNESPEIKGMLESLHRNAIPLLAIFPADGSSPPVLLDGILTKGAVLDALEKVGGKASELTTAAR